MASTSQQPSSRSDYTVACICPMGIELAPVIAMLDHIHEPLSTERDSNAYTLGKIGKHNVVVAVLPEIGNNAAAILATQLLNDFPSIRFGLLVGVGGGVPGDEEDSDIRLGDVVVSQPTATFGGVVQYDLGKRLAHGGFKRTGQLNKPPTILSTNVRKLQAQHLMLGSQIPVHISDMIQRYPKMQARYSLPATEHDYLFISSYTHSLGTTCRGCDLGQTIPRSNRPDKEPQVLYGTIGSANVVVKDAEVRDALKTDMNILCIEMEAAGLMDTFPCLVIRGICDYADSHKNKRWQPYAAAVAAAYMKELLMLIPIQQVHQTVRAQEIVIKDSKTHDLLDQSVKLQQHTLEHQRHQALELEIRHQCEQERQCHQYFASIYEQYKDVNPARAPGTCKWVLDHAQFRTWQHSSHSDLLWISADPGCGKSVLAKSLIDHELHEVNQSTVCYFFFKDNEQQDKLAIAIKALLHQLFSQQPQLIRHAIPVWEKKGGKVPYETSEMWRIFLDATADPTSSATICVLDALDECQEDDRRTLITLLCDFYRRSSTNTSQSILKFLITSRPYDSVQRWFDQITSKLPQIRLRGEDENDKIRDEINLVINQRVNELTTTFHLSNEHQKSLRQKLVQMEHRTYLWLHLAIEEIRDSYSSSLYHSEVQINSLPISVDNAYERILERINAKAKPNALKVLLIIVGARRPLTIGEMALALSATRAHEMDSLSMQELDKTWLEKQIRQWCGLFVFINHSMLFLIHQTAKEFLLANGSHTDHTTSGWKSSFTMPQVDKEMASLCVQYLYLSQFDNLFDENKNEISDQPHGIQWPTRVDKYEFFAYCAEQWASHLDDQCVAADEKLLDKVHSLYDTKGYELVVKWPLDTRANINAQRGRHGNALWLASASGHDKVVQMLVDAGADVNTQERDRRNPVWAASAGGHEKVVQILLDAGADVNTQGGEYNNALGAASAGGYEKVVQILVGAGADVNAQGERYGSVLQAASARGHEKVVQILVDAGADVNAQGEKYGNALQAASDSSHEKVVQILVGAGADVNVQGGYYGSALQAASAHGHEKVAQILVDAGADVNAYGGFYCSALQAALAGGYEEIIQILVIAGANVDTQGGDYGMLYTASERGYKKVVQTLLDVGANVNSERGRHGNALRAASASGHEKVVQMLVDAGANVNSEEEHYTSALEAASARGYEKIVQILVDAGASVNAQGGNYGSALRTASACGHRKVVQILLDAGANVNTEGGRFDNALFDALEGGHRKVVRMLLERFTTSLDERQYVKALRMALFSGDTTSAQLLMASFEVNQATVLAQLINLGLPRFEQISKTAARFMNGDSWKYISWRDLSFS